MNWDHPILKHILQNKSREIQSPHFFQAFQFSGRLPDPVITYQNDIPCLVELHSGNGKLLLFNGDLDTENSDLIYSTFFPPLLNRMVLYLASHQQHSSKKHFVGEPVMLSIDEEEAEGACTVEWPDATISYLMPEIYNDRLQLVQDETDIPGLYHFYSERGYLGVRSINISPNESDFKRIDENIIARIMHDREVRFLNSQKDIVEQIKSFHTGKEFNQFFLLIGLMLLLTEMLLVKLAAKNQDKRS